MTTPLFPWLVAVLEAGACVECLLRGRWLLAVLWGGYAVAAFALAMVK